jgi:processing peptidase subunit beta
MLALGRFLRPGNSESVRTFFGKAIVASENTPFLKYSSPVPVPIDHDQVLASLPETKVSTLPNGLWIASESSPFSNSATIGVWIISGSRFETDETHGSAKFLEHLLFKGTKTKSGAALAAEVEKMGAKVTAYTGREQTGITLTVPSNQATAAVKLLGEVLTSPAFDEASIEAERKSILMDYKMVNKEMSELVFDHLHATAFQYSPLGRCAYGPSENMMSISKQDIESYMAINFKGPRMVLSAAGAVDHDELVKAAGAALGSIPDATDDVSVRSIVAKDPFKYTGSSVMDRWPSVPECCYAIGYKGASWTDPDAVALMVMAKMLGSWNKTQSAVGKHATSGMVQRLSITGAVDAVTAFNINYADTGLFGVYVVTDRPRCEDSNAVVINELTQMAYDINDIEVQYAKNQLKASHLYDQDDSAKAAESLARDLLVFNRKISKAEWFARIDAVDTNAIRAVGDRFLYDTDVVIAAAGDTQYMRDYNWWRRRTWWGRY